MTVPLKSFSPGPTLSDTGALTTRQRVGPDRAGTVTGAKTPLSSQLAPCLVAGPGTGWDSWPLCSPLYSIATCCTLPVSGSHSIEKPPFATTV